jgi:hypothetical protein
LQRFSVEKAANIVQQNIVDNDSINRAYGIFCKK